ncbi:MAG: magnesium and cobalt transport protein CorA [Hydrogenophilales bacterium]|nr:magnesium and cobalt transport protein CorA [Hydrogenophilales bacterium]
MNDNANCYVFRADGHERLTIDAISDALASADTFVWLDIEQPEQWLLQKLAEELTLHELVLEDALAAHQRPKIENYPDSVFLALQAASWWQGRVHFGEVHVFCGRNYLCVVRHSPRIACRKPLEQLFQPATARCGDGLYHVLDCLVDDYMPAFQAAEEQHRALEEAMLADGFRGNRLSQLYGLRRELLGLHAMIEPMDAICMTLIREHPMLVTKELKAYYRDIHDHVMRLMRSLDRLSHMLDDAMQLSIAAVSLKQNESVQKLAGWGAILAIPTLVFSLYGMNFEGMPELHWPWAYPLTLLGTGMACFVLYRRLKRDGWV